MKNIYFLFMTLFVCQISIANHSVVTDPTMPTLSNLSVCDNNNDGFSIFDLTVQNVPILAAQSGAASNYSISYYETPTDATIGANPINNPNAYYNFNSNSQTIYVRIRNVNTSADAFGQFQIIVNQAPFATGPQNFVDCDYDFNPYDGVSVLDLTEFATSILGGQNPSLFTVLYFTTQINAEAGVGPIIIAADYVAVNGEVIWVRVQNNLTGCYALTTINIVINVPPLVSTPTPLSVCDDDANPNDQYHSFDLTVKNNEITQSPNSYVAYFPSLSDAYNYSNIITTPTNYTNVQPAIQTVGVRVTDAGPTGCVSFTTLDIRVLPIPTPNTNPPALVACDGNNDGVEVFDLSTNLNYISNGDPFLSYSFYQTLSDAQADTNAFPAPTVYLSASGSVWVRVENNRVDYNGNNCYVLVEQQLVVTNNLQLLVYSQNNANSICVDYITNAVIRDLTLQTNTGDTSAYSFEWFEASNPTTVIGTGATYTVSTPALNGATSHYSVVATSNSFSGCSGTSTPFSVIQSSQAVVPYNEIGYSVINLSGVKSIIVSIEGYGTYEYALDNGPRQTSNVFDNVSLGVHSFEVFDTEGGIIYSCDSLIINNIQIGASLVPAPTGLNSQSFTTGATLANLAVTGSNIQWYASATSTIPLPLNTVLVNGTTYYATQTVGGIQSTARIAVTVQVTLGLTSNEILTLQYAPNPVKNVLTLQSNTILKSVLVYNLLGQKVIEQVVNDSNVTIDFSFLPSGNYMVKAQGETAQKTIKILKQ